MQHSPFYKKTRRKVRRLLFGDPLIKGAKRSFIITEEVDVGRFRENLEYFSPATENETDDAPIFIFSVGWRAGSTLLQRILMTDPRVIIWGEPYSHMAMATKFTHALDAIQARRWPSSAWFVESFKPCDFQGGKVGNLYPPPSDFKASLREFYNRLCRKPAEEHGFDIWGIKEVRYSALEAVFFKWLYPKCKIILLIRNPLHSYRSFKGNNWFTEWPNRVLNIDQWLEHWNRMVNSWREFDDEFIQIKYEDLISGSFDFRELESRLGLELNEQAAMTRNPRSTRNKRLSRREARFILHQAGDAMRHYGYVDAGEPKVSGLAPQHI